MNAPKYQVLARKYRPQKFTQVVGQESILQTLRNALKRDAIAHAYLFCGSRGVGKTTLARLFAKALNCTNPTSDYEPCNQCPSCAEITAGQSLDVIEIDGASNRGIDDIRQINETVGFAPSHGRYKIYIIDEVHMLTKEAFNALLKTLEEPPPQVKFFFATTEPHKVLPTIISRCQRFDLGRLMPAEIETKLQAIAKDLGRSIDPEALHLLTQFADGSLRDAESLFDQLLCFASDAVTAADVRQTLGLAPKELFFTLDQAFSEGRLGYAFELTAQLFEAGKDLSHFLDQLIEHYRHLTLCKTLGPQTLQLPSELKKSYTASSQHYTQSQCLFILDLLIRAESTLSKSASARTTLELTLLNILRAKHRIPVETLVRRLSELEEKLGKKITQPLPAILEPQIASEIITPPPKDPLDIATPTEKPQPEPPIAPKTPTLASPIKPISDAPQAATTEVTKLQLPEKSMILSPIAKAAELPNPEYSCPTPEGWVKDSGRNPPQKGDFSGRSSFATASTEPLSKHPSYYDTLIRFAAVELEGTVHRK